MQRLLTFATRKALALLLHLQAVAVLAEGKGDTEQAMAYLQEVLTLAQQLQLPGEQGQILAALST